MLSSSRWLSWLRFGFSWRLSWLHFGCSWLLLGVSRGSLGLLWMRLRPSSPPIRRSGVLKNVAQTTFAIQTSNSRKCYYSERNIVIFDARRAGVGAQNPPEEGSQGVKRPVRRGLTEMRRDEKQYIISRQIELIIVNVCLLYTSPSPRDS